MKRTTGRPATVARIIARTNVGGPALQVTALMRGLDRDKYRQVLLRGSVDLGEADYLELRAPDVESVVVPGLGRSVKPLDDARALWFLVRALRTHRPLIVHTHTAKAGVLGRVAAVVTRAPIRVHTFHGHVLHGYFGARMTKLVVLVERLLARVTTYTVAVGEQVRTDLVEARIAKPDRSRVIAPGVASPTPHDRAAARASIGLHGDELAVVFVGRLTRIKRPERFVELARTLADRLPNARFVIVGDGPSRAELEASANDLGNLTFAGWRGDMAEVYAASDLIVLTSDNEGMPVALIEAAMQGVPAVAADVGAVRQVVADGVSGVVVRAGDAERLATAVESVARDPERRAEMGRSAAQRAEQLFGENRLVADYEALYDELIDELTRGRRRRQG